MVDFRFKCPQCGEPLVSSRKKGDTIACPTCRMPVEVPSQAVEIIPADLVEVQTPRRYATPENNDLPPRVNIKQRGCFYQGFNCGCGCLLILIVLSAIVYGIASLFI